MIMARTNHNWLRGIAHGALLAMGSLAALPVIAPAELLAQTRNEVDSKVIIGSIARFTLAPNDQIDGAVLDNGTVIHWPPHMERKITACVSKGDRIRVAGRMGAGPAGDSRFEAQHITNLNTTIGHEIVDNPLAPLPVPSRPAEKTPDPVAPPPVDRLRTPAAPPANAVPNRTLRGTVQKFTTNAQGVVDGAVLDDGTLVHWPPALQKRFTGAFVKGDPIRVTGRMENGTTGSVLEAQVVTNLRTDITVDSNEGTAAPAPAARQVDNYDDRLRNLEDKIDRLTKEIERLRREK